SFAEWRPSIGLHWLSPAPRPHTSSRSGNPSWHDHNLPFTAWTDGFPSTGAAAFRFRAGARFETIGAGFTAFDLALAARPVGPFFDSIRRLRAAILRGFATGLFFAT